MDTNNGYLNQSEIGRLYDTTRQTVGRYMENGRLPSQVNGRGERVAHVGDVEKIWKLRPGKEEGEAVTKGDPVTGSNSAGMVYENELKDQKIKFLEEKVESLLASEEKNEERHEKYLARIDKITLMLEDKSKNSHNESGKKYSELKETLEKQGQQMKALEAKQEKERKELEERLREANASNEKILQERDDEKQRAQRLGVKLRKEKNKGFWDRVFNRPAA